jgi:hypothetical protein
LAICACLPFLGKVNNVTSEIIRSRDLIQEALNSMFCIDITVGSVWSLSRANPPLFRLLVSSFLAFHFDTALSFTVLFRKEILGLHGAFIQGLPLISL